MAKHTALPADLGDGFPTWLARAHGVSRSRLRGSDLTAPFHGVRKAQDATPHPAFADIEDPYLRQRLMRIASALDYAPRMHTGHFFSHETAAAIWGAPLPLTFSTYGDDIESTALDLHVCALGGLAVPRTQGVTRHRTRKSMVEMVVHDGLRVSSPASTWAMLGTLSVADLVALGDFFCRQFRPGYGRPDADRKPLATIDELREALVAGRRRGAERLREAVELVREDSWSPRESRVRCILIAAGLPEPELNVDVYDGVRFLACVDLAYPRQRVAIEYHGMLHGMQWARDAERVAALRAAGWTVIEVTAPLLKSPEELVRRVRQALA